MPAEAAIVQFGLDTVMVPQDGEHRMEQYESLTHTKWECKLCGVLAASMRERAW